MRLENLYIMSWQNLMRNKKRVFFSSLGVVIGIATLIFFFSLTNGARDLIFDHFLKKLPANQVKLNPKYKSDLAGYMIQKMIGKKPEKEEANEGLITLEKVEELKKLEGVQKIFGIQQVQSRSYLVGFNEETGPNTATGLSSHTFEYLAEDIPKEIDWSWKKGQKQVPAFINPQLLIMWNEFFADQMDYPRLKKETIMTVPLYLRIGGINVPETQRFQLKIVGMSNKAPLLAPLVPEEFVIAMNRDLLGEDYPIFYSSLIVGMENPSYLEELMVKFDEMGYETSSEQRVAEMIDMGINVLTIFLTVISLIIVFISLVNVFNIFLVNVMERKFEIGVMRSVGASRSNIRAIILAESTFIGLVNGVIGSLIGLIIVLMTEQILISYFQNLIPPDTAILAINFELILAVIVISPLVNMLAVLQPANYAARLDPVAALRR